MSNDNADDGDGGLIFKLVLTGVVLFLAPWGLVFEPGPLSEMAAISVLAGLWGIPLLDGEQPDENSDEN